MPMHASNNSVRKAYKKLMNETRNTELASPSLALEVKNEMNSRAVQHYNLQEQVPCVESDPKWKISSQLNLIYIYREQGGKGIERKKKKRSSSSTSTMHERESMAKCVCVFFVCTFTGFFYSG